MSQKLFLANSNNKQAFTELLANALREDGYNIVLCQGDADVSIVSCVLDVACLGRKVTLIGSDTDLLIMLLYMWNNLMGEIEMKSEATRKYSETVRNTRFFFIRNDKTASSTRSFLIFTLFLVPKISQQFLELNFC